MVQLHMADSVVFKLVFKLVDGTIAVKDATSGAAELERFKLGQREYELPWIEVASGEFINRDSIIAVRLQPETRTQRDPRRKREIPPEQKQAISVGIRNMQF